MIFVHHVFYLKSLNLLIFLHTKTTEYSAEKALKWPDRLAILIGVAKAVHFLHTGVIPGCFSNQLKTKSVLLDEHCIPKLSDYGMSIIKEDIEKFEVCFNQSFNLNTVFFYHDLI
jgi:hypothetical protein